MKITDEIERRAPPRFESQADRMTHLLVEYRTPITLATVSALILVLSGRASIPEIPPIAKVALIGMAAGAIPAAAAGKILIVDPFIEEPTTAVAELNVDDKSIDVREIPNQLWADRKEGERSPWQPETGNIDYVVSELEYLDDLHKLSVEGVNRELVDPVDMIVRDQRISEIHQDLQTTAAEYQRYQARERTRRLERDRELVTSLIAAVEHGLEFEPGTEEAIQDDSLDDLVDEEPGRSEANRTDADDNADMQTLNQVLGYEQEALSNGDADTAVGGDQP